MESGERLSLKHLKNQTKDDDRFKDALMDVMKAMRYQTDHTGLFIPTETLLIVRAALERCSPSKPVITEGDERVAGFYCPLCHGKLKMRTVTTKAERHCHYCGQAIDWGNLAKFYGKNSNEDGGDDE